MATFSDIRESIFAQFNTAVKLESDGEEKSITAFFRRVAVDENVDGEYHLGTEYRLYLKTEDYKIINNDTIFKIEKTKGEEELFKVNHSYHVDKHIMVDGSINVVVLEKVKSG